MSGIISVYSQFQVPPAPPQESTRIKVKPGSFQSSWGVAAAAAAVANGTVTARRRPCITGGLSGWARKPGREESYCKGEWMEATSLRTVHSRRAESQGSEATQGSAGSYRPTEDQSAGRHGEAHATCTGQTIGAAHARTCTGSSRARVTSAGTSASRGARTAAGRVRRGAAQRPSQEAGSSRGSTRTAGARRGRAGTDTTGTEGPDAATRVLGRRDLPLQGLRA